MTTPASEPPGWKADPTDPNAERYWNGYEWTPMRRQHNSTVQPPPTSMLPPAGTPPFTAPPPAASPAPFPYPGSGRPGNPLQRNPWIAIGIGAAVVVVVLTTVLISIRSSGGHSRPSVSTAAGQMPGTVTGGEMDWVNAVCRLGTFMDGRSTLPDATGKGFCQAKNGGDYVSIGEYDSDYKMRNALVLTQERYYASAIGPDGTVVVLAVRGSASELQPLTQYGFTINSVQQLR